MNDSEEWSTEKVPDAFPVGSLVRRGIVGPVGVVVAWQGVRRIVRYLDDGTEEDRGTASLIRAWRSCSNCKHPVEAHDFGKCLFSTTYYEAQTVKPFFRGGQP